MAFPVQRPPRLASASFSPCLLCLQVPLCASCAAVLAMSWSQLECAPSSTSKIMNHREKKVLKISGAARHEQGACLAAESAGFSGLASAQVSSGGPGRRRCRPVSAAQSNDIPPPSPPTAFCLSLPPALFSRRSRGRAGLLRPISRPAAAAAAASLDWPTTFGYRHIRAGPERPGRVGGREG